MNRNVSIIIIVLVFVIIAGYLVWLRSRFQPPVSPKASEPVPTSVQPTQTPEATASAAPVKEATSSNKTKSATGSAKGR